MKRILVNALLVIAAVIAIAHQAVAQADRSPKSTPNEDRQILKALLEEVHQLRQDVGRNQAFSQRLQVTLESIRLQQSRVDSLTRTLQTTRSHLSEMSEARLRIENEIKDSQEHVTREPEADARSILESQIKEMKNRLGSLSREEEEALSREAELSVDLQQTQTKLNASNGQLDDMVRRLDTHD